MGLPFTIAAFCAVARGLMNRAAQAVERAKWESDFIVSLSKERKDKIKGMD
jgi:hypothetical protein